MNGIENPIVFYPAAAVMLLFSLLTIKFNNIFYSLLSAIVVFFLAGMFFYVLGSEYNAVIQIAIYGVAVPVILALAIMFTDLKNKNKIKNSSLKKSIIFLISGLFILSLIWLVLMSFIFSPEGFNITVPAQTNPVGTIQAFSQGIFVKYVFAFELISVILTMIVAGLTIKWQK